MVINHRAVSRGDRIRTCDPLVPNQVRYRPALLPELKEIPKTEVQIPEGIISFGGRSLTLISKNYAVRAGFEPAVHG